MTSALETLLTELEKVNYEASPLLHDKDFNFYRPAFTAGGEDGVPVVESKLLDVPMSRIDIRAYGELKSSIPRLLAIIREQEKALKAVQSHCLCTRNVKGFDYGETHPILGKNRNGARWNVPFDVIENCIERTEAIVKGGTG